MYLISHDGCLVYKQLWWVSNAWLHLVTIPVSTGCQYYTKVLFQVIRLASYACLDQNIFETPDFWRYAFKHRNTGLQVMYVCILMFNSKQWNFAYQTLARDFPGIRRREFIASFQSLGTRIVCFHSRTIPPF